MLSRIIAVCLVCWWQKHETDQLYWLLQSLGDIIFEFSSMGVGAQFDMEKFRHLVALSFCFFAKYDIIPTPDY